MGVVNVTPDSFSDGGAFLDAARGRSRHGAPARRRGRRDPRRRRRVHPPGRRRRCRAEEELRRVVPGRRGARRASARAISIDTIEGRRRRARRSTPAPTTSTTSPRSATTRSWPALVAERGVDCCLMHMLGEPRTMQHDPRYDDVVSDVKAFLEERLASAVARGRRRGARPARPRDRLRQDASSTTSSCCARLDEIAALGRPVVLGTSRKSFLGRLTGRDVGRARAGDRRHVRDRARARGARLPRPRRRRRRATRSTVAAATLARAMARTTPEDYDDDDLTDDDDDERKAPRSASRSRSSGSRSTRTTASPRPSARSASGSCSTSASTSASRTR